VEVKEREEVETCRHKKGVAMQMVTEEICRHMEVVVKEREVE